MRRRSLTRVAIAAIVCTLLVPAVAIAGQRKFSGKVAAQPNSGIALTVAYKRKRPRRILDFRWANITFNCDGTPRNIVGAERNFNPDVKVSKKTKKRRKQRFRFNDSGIDHLMKVTGVFSKNKNRPLRIRGTLQIVDTFDGTMCDSGVVRFNLTRSAPPPTP